MVRVGRVVDRQADSLRVCFDRPEMCEKCGACMGKAHKELVTLKGDAQPGDTVEVEMPDAKVLKVSAIAYVVPLLGLLLGLLIGQTWMRTDSAAAVGGLIGLALAWGGLILFDKKIAKKKQWQPKIIAVRPRKEGEQ